ncbi:Rho GTPase activation protein [Poronia punctata]|nr:Rho GTPase activation protein [Poronia punctata]
MDETLALRQASTPGSAEARHRVGSGSFSSSTSQPLMDSELRHPSAVLDATAYGSKIYTRQTDERAPVSTSKDKKPSNRHGAKRVPRPTSPLISPPPSVDSLLLPIPTDDANRMLSLMRRLCGRMRGEVEYQSDPNAPWYEGIFYIDEDKGSLMFDSAHTGSFHITIISDLRGCRVLPCKTPGDGLSCLELSSARVGVEILFRPLISDELDLWLASLLCWQQVRPPGVRLTSGTGPTSPGFGRPVETRKRGSSTVTPTYKDPAIIKVGNVLLWDKGAATSPRAIVKRPSTRDLRSGMTCWRRVSCILQDNGEFKLMTENDVTVLSVIDLSQLSRLAVQRLDRSVLDEDFCIGIFPVYSPNSKQLSIFRPVYLALDSRVLFEVWLVLLRAFAVPDLYAIEASTGHITEVQDLDAGLDGQLFRIEKSIQIRATEAKVQKMTAPSERQYSYRDRDPLAGNYLAEILLDGEVRARTAVQQDTKNPFWRDSTQFTDLPAALPCLSVVLKRLDGDLGTLVPNMQAVCGVVEVPLEKLDKGKEHEEWYPILDEKQESVGTMLVRVEYGELVVLTARDYQPLSAILHTFSTGLTGQITQSLPGMIRRLSEIFLNIFQVSVEDEIDGVGSQNSLKRLRFSRRMKSNESSTSASDREQLVRDMSKSLTGEANLLFRGNTLLTQALEFHMRRLGKEYLEDVLGDKLSEINEINPDCEVDPSKVERPEDLAQHWDVLIRLTTEVWHIELRAILKYVRAVAEDRYGDFLRTVNYTSVSGFLFLRFICPAILNPKLFGLLRDYPRPRLQALANLTQFLSQNRQSFRDYIDQLCSVPTDRNAITVPASYSTPVMILGRLPPKSREGFPSLPYLIDHQRNFAALVKMWLDTHHDSAAETQMLEGELREFHKLCVDLQRRSDACLAQVDICRAAAENESVVTDDLTESLEKASLIGSWNPSYASSAVWAENDPYRPPVSPDSEIDDGDRASRRHFIRETKSSGTVRTKAKGGKEARRFLKGPNLSSTVRDKGSRGIMSNLPESWQQNDTNQRH